MSSDRWATCLELARTPRVPGVDGPPNEFESKWRNITLTENSNQPSDSPATPGTSTEAPDRRAVAPQPGHAVRIDNLSVQAGQRQLLEGASAQFPAGKISLIIGPSGVGKSVLLRLIAGLIPGDHPSIHYRGAISIGDETQPMPDSAPPPEGSRAAEANARRRARNVGTVGVVFQSFALFDELSPAANVAIARDHRFGRSRELDIRHLLATLDVPTDVRTSLLSGGQRQRLAIARALAFDPPAILYDEPTSGLDPSTARHVATLIRATQQESGKTSVIVTHDYHSLLSIADHVVILNPITAQLNDVPRGEWDQIDERLKPLADQASEKQDGEVRQQPRWPWARTLPGLIPFASRAVEALVVGLLSLIPTWRSFKWGLRYLAHYARLVAGPTAWFYMLMAGVIIGFVTTYFVFRFLPFASYTQPLIIEELLSAMGFSLYRIFIPVLATVMIAARSGAAVTADVGGKQYGNQIDAMLTIGVNPRSYLLTPIMISFVIGTPLLTLFAFWAARLTSLVTFSYTQPGHTPDFWYQYFHYSLQVIGSRFYFGTHWLLAKLAICGIGTGVIAYFQGRRPKYSPSDVSHSVTVAILWTTLYVLIVHFIFAFYEFNVLPRDAV